MSARRTCNALISSAQKRQSPLGSCRLRCEPGVGPQCILVLSTPVWPLGGVIAPPGPDLDAFHYPFPAVKLDINVSACLCCVCCPGVGFLLCLSRVKVVVCG